MKAMSFLGVLVLVSCGELPKLPPKFHEGRLPVPSGLEVAVRDSVLEISWEAAGVEKFLISVSDTSRFSFERFVDTTYAEVVVPGGSVYFVRVMAVDDELFVGPAAVDTVSLPYPLK